MEGADQKRDAALHEATGDEGDEGDGGESKGLEVRLGASAALLRLGLPSLALSALILGTSWDKTKAENDGKARDPYEEEDEEAEADPRFLLARAAALGALAVLHPPSASSGSSGGGGGGPPPHQKVCHQGDKGDPIKILARLITREKKAKRQGGAVSMEAAELQGHLHYAAGRFKEAVRAYRLARDLAIGTGLPSSPKLYSRLARAYLALGHPAYAMETYNQACTAAPAASWAWLGLATCRTSIGSLFEEAAAALAEALALDPENPDAWGRLAVVAAKGGRRDEAASALKAAIRLGLEDPSLISELVGVYGSKEMGQRKTAENLMMLIP